MQWILRYRQLLLAVVVALTLFFAYQLKDLNIDFSFEQFYPDETPEALYYKSFKKRYAHDQDFMISVAIKSPKADVFDSTFLNQAYRCFDTLMHLRLVDSAAAATHLSYPKRSGMGYKEHPYLRFDTQEEVAESKAKMWNDSVLLGSFVSQDRQYLAAHLLVSAAVFDTKAKDTLCQNIEQILQQSGFEYHLTGIPYIRAQYTRILRYEAVLFTLLGLSILSLLLYVVFRNVWIVGLTMLTVIVGEIWTYGLMCALGQPITLITNLLIPVIMVVGVSDILHIATRYLSELKHGTETKAAMQSTLDEIGLATFITCITTATGFAALAICDVGFMKPLLDTLGLQYLFGEDIPPLRIFGLYGGFGVVVTYLISITFIPNVLLAIPAQKLRATRSLESSGKWDEWLFKMQQFSIQKHKWILSVTAIVLLVSFVGMSKIPTNIHLFEELKPSDPVTKSILFFEKEFFGVRPFELDIVSKNGKKLTELAMLRQIEKIQTYLEQDSAYSTMLSPVTFLKTANYVYHFNKAEFYALPDSQEQVAELIAFTEQHGADGFLRKILSEDQTSGRISSRAKDLGGSAHNDKMIQTADFIRQHCDTSLFSYTFTGYGTLSEQSLIYLTDNMLNGLIIDFLIIGLVMWLVFRSLRMTILAMIPNVIPLFITAGIMGFADVTLTASTAIIFVVIFGIAVDDTLHFVSHYLIEIRRGVPKQQALNQTVQGTGKAIVLASCILTGGFSVLLSSSFGGTTIIGLFSVITIIVAVFTDLLLAPWLIHRFGEGKD